MQGGGMVATRTNQAYLVFTQLLRVLGLRGRGLPQRDDETACALYRAPAWDVLQPRPPPSPPWRAAAAPLVLLVLLARPLAFTALWMADGCADSLLAGTLCFLWMVPVQYAQAWRYLTIDHIDSHWMRCHGENHPWFGVAAHPMPPTPRAETPAWFGVKQGPGRFSLGRRAWKTLRESSPSYIPLFGFVLLLLGSTLLACLMTDDQLGQSYILFFGPHFAKYTSPKLRVLGRALAIFDTVFGRVSQMLNVGMFLLVFCHHLEDMAHLIELFELRHAFSFPKTLDRVAETQACLAHSTGRLHGVFTSSSLLGGLGLALCLRRASGMTPYLLFCAAVYAAVQGVFLLMVRALGARRRRLLDTAYSLKFTRACLHRNTEDSRTSVVARETGSTVDWLALTQLLEQRWVQFTLCGIDLQDGQLVTRCAWLVGLLVAGRRLLGS